MKTLSLSAFIKTWVSSPRVVGAICPSSRGLGRRMASFIPSSTKGLVIELGGGTGVVTSALLEKGIPQDQIVVVEYSQEMVRVLKKKFPLLTVIQGDASFLADLLKKHLGDQHDPVDAVVSSLPLRSLPTTTVEAIMKQLNSLLGEKGQYIQFTYDLRSNMPCPLKQFSRRDSKIVWFNIPPARVDLFCR